MHVHSTLSTAVKKSAFQTNSSITNEPRSCCQLSSRAHAVSFCGECPLSKALLQPGHFRQRGVRVDTHRRTPIRPSDTDTDAPARAIQSQGDETQSHTVPQSGVRPTWKKTGPRPGHAEWARTRSTACSPRHRAATWHSRSEVESQHTHFRLQLPGAAEPRPSGVG